MSQRQLDILNSLDIDVEDDIVDLNEDVNDIQIEEVIDALSVMPNLKELSLSDNQLTTLPETIGNLQSLELLNLDNNQLTKEEIERCEKDNAARLSLIKSDVIEDLPPR